MGYSAKEAANMRNRSTARLIEDYREAMSDYHEKRKEQYERPPGEKIERVPRPYRPEIPIEESTTPAYESMFRDYGISEGHLDQIMADGDAFQMDIYERRFAGLQEFFNNNSPYTWDELMDMLGEITDLGDFLDAIGELYDENNG